MVNLPRMLLAQQGSDAKVPAEDFRLAIGALLQPGGTTALSAASGVVAGSGSVGTTGCEVDSPSSATLRVQPGSFVIQRSVTNGGAYIGTIDAITTVPVANLPGVGQFKAGYLVVHAYDEAYGDVQDLAALEIVLGAAATTAGNAAFPSVPANALALASFTVNSSGTVAFTTGFVVPRVTARGGITPVAAGDTSTGDYDGQWRDVAGVLQRWYAAGAAWSRPVCMTWGSGTNFPSSPGLGDVYDHTGMHCQLVYTANGWRQNSIAEVADSTAMNAISTSYKAWLHPGFEVWVDTYGTRYTWTGTAWGFPNGGPEYFGPSTPTGSIPDGAVYFQTSS